MSYAAIVTFVPILMQIFARKVLAAAISQQFSETTVRKTEVSMARHGTASHRKQTTNHNKPVFLEWKFKVFDFH